MPASVPPAANLVVEGFVLLVGLVCWVDAWRRGRRWFALAMGAPVFALAAESYYLTTEGHDSPGVWYARSWKGRDLWVPVASMPIALLILGGCQWGLVHAVSPTAGEAGGFLGVFLGALLAVGLGRKGGIRDNPPSPVVIGLPLACHGFLLAMVLAHLPENSALVVAIPAHGVLSGLVFSWSSVDSPWFRGHS